MARALFTNPDGRVSVVIPAPGVAIEDAVAGAVPNGLAYIIVDDSEIPSDRTYRNAWELAGGQVAHNMAKARELHRVYMRAAREPMLAALDVAYQRADERGPAGAAEKAAITAQKQALRDVTDDPAIAAAVTVAQLKAVWPAILGAKLYERPAP